MFAKRCSSIFCRVQRMTCLSTLNIIDQSSRQWRTAVLARLQVRQIQAGIEIVKERDKMPGLNAAQQSQSIKKHLPLPQGPHVVGCVDYMTSYSKEGSFMRIYYPTRENNIMEHTNDWPPWTPRQEYQNGYAHFMKMWPLLFRKVFRWSAGGEMHIPCISNADVLRDEGTLPVIFFSHGMGGCRTAYSVHCCELASHGFVVVAVEHRDASGCLSYYLSPPEGSENGKMLTTPQWVPYRHLKRNEDEVAVRNKQIYVRRAELKDAVDLVEKLNAGQSVENVMEVDFDLNQFKGRLNLDKMAAVGHSFGAATVLVTLPFEPRFKVGVAMDAWLLPIKKESSELFDKIRTPFLFVNMDNFQTNESLDIMRHFVEAKTKEQRKLYKIRGSVHQNQADTPFLVSGWVRRLAGANSDLDPNIVMGLNNRLVLGFLWKHLDIPPHPTYNDYFHDHESHVIENAFQVDA